MSLSLHTKGKQRCAGKTILNYPVITGDGIFAKSANYSDTFSHGQNLFLNNNLTHQ